MHKSPISKHSLFHKLYFHKYSFTKTQISQIIFFIQLPDPSNTKNPNNSQMQTFIQVKKKVT